MSEHPRFIGKAFTRASEFSDGKPIPTPAKTFETWLHAHFAPERHRNIGVTAERSKMAVKIRRAEHSDSDAITSLMHLSAAYKGKYGQIIVGYRVTPHQIDRDLVYLAENENGIIGFYSLVTEPAPELDLMFVSDAAQGTAVGRQLFDHMKMTAADNGIVQVKIVSHPPSVGFYERMGAEVVGIKPPSANTTWERPILRLTIRR